MPTRFAVAHSLSPDSASAGSEAVRRALADCPNPTLALLFCTARHDPRALHAAVRSIIGPRCPIIGGYAVGIITREHLSYDGAEVAVALMASDTATVSAFSQQGLADNESACGKALAAQLAPTLESHSNLLLFYDTVNLTSGQLKLNMGTPLIAGMTKVLGANWPRMAGMGMIGDMQLHPTFQFFDDRIDQQSAIALLINGPLRMDTVIMHGCRPAGRYRTITKTDNQVVLEIDDQPALEVIAQMLGPEAGLSWDDYAFFVTLGLNKGDPYGDFREEDYANRLCIGVDKARKGLVMFENDLKPGMKVQLMRRSIDFEYVQARTRALLEQAAGRTPRFAFYIDCAGRAAAYCGMDEEEADQVRQALPPDVPLLGVYSGVEIARVGGDIQALDWTGVLCLFSE